MKKGFTLIELMIAVVIIGLAFYALIAVLTNLLPKNINSQSLAIGSHLMNKKMEEIGLSSFNSTTSEAAASFSSPFSNYNYQVAVNYVTTAEPNVNSASPTNFKKIAVRVWGAQLSSLEGVTLVVTYEVTKT